MVLSFSSTLGVNFTNPVFSFLLFCKKHFLNVVFAKVFFFSEVAYILYISYLCVIPNRKEKHLLGRIQHLKNKRILHATLKRSMYLSSNIARKIEVLSQFKFISTDLFIQGHITLDETSQIL